MSALRIAGIAAVVLLAAGVIMNFGDMMRYIKIERM